MLRQNKYGLRDGQISTQSTSFEKPLQYPPPRTCNLTPLPYTHSVHCYPPGLRVLLEAFPGCPRDHPSAMHPTAPLVYSAPVQHHAAQLVRVPRRHIRPGHSRCWQLGRELRRHNPLGYTRHAAVRAHPENFVVQQREGAMCCTQLCNPAPAAAAAAVPGLEHCVPRMGHQRAVGHKDLRPVHREGFQWGRLALRPEFNRCMQDPDPGWFSGGREV